MSKTTTHNTLPFWTGFLIGATASQKSKPTSVAMKTNFRLGQTIKNKKTRTKANVTAICNDYIVAVSYDHGAFRIYADRIEDFE